MLSSFFVSGCSLPDKCLLPAFLLQFRTGSAMRSRSRESTFQPCKYHAYVRLSHLGRGLHRATTASGYDGILYLGTSKFPPDP